MSAQELAAFEQYASEGNRSWLPPDATIIKFNSLTGRWFDPKNPDLTEDLSGKRQLVADVRNVHHGYQKFDGNIPVDNRIVRIDRKLPLREELGDLDQSRWEKGFNGQPKDPWV